MKIKDAIKNGKIPNVKIESIFQSLERLGINVSKNSRTAEYDLEDKIIDKLRIYINASISFNKYNNEVNNEINQVEEKNEKTIPYFRVVGQVLLTYIIIEIKDGFYIVDQHAANERINYEKFTKLLNSKIWLNSRISLPIFIFESLLFGAKKSFIIACVPLLGCFIIKSLFLKLNIRFSNSSFITMLSYSFAMI